MRTQTRLMLDAALAVALIAAYNPKWTGITLHEWLSIAVIAPLLLHLFVNWDWALRILRTFIERLMHASRLNFVVDCALMVATVTVMVSGFVVSSLFGIRDAQPLVWHYVHLWSAHTTLFLLALHGVLHWRWVTATVKRLTTQTADRREVRAPRPATAERALSAREITLEDRRRLRRERAQKKAAAERALVMRVVSLAGVTATLGLAVLFGVGLASPLLASAAQPKAASGKAAVQTCPKTGCTASRCHAAYGQSAATFYKKTTAASKPVSMKRRVPKARRTTTKRTSSSSSATTAKKAATSTKPAASTTAAHAAVKPKPKAHLYTCPATGCQNARCHGTAGQSASSFYN